MGQYSPDIAIRITSIIWLTNSMYRLKVGQHDPGIEDKHNPTTPCFVGMAVTLDKTHITGTLFQMAQLTYGLPWLIESAVGSDSDPGFYGGKVETLRYTMNISHFANWYQPTLVSDSSKVLLKYHIEDLHGSSYLYSMPSGWEAIVETKCEMLNGSQELAQKLSNSPISEGGYKRCAGSYRWISQAPHGKQKGNKTTAICTSNVNTHLPC